MMFGDVYVDYPWLLALAVLLWWRSSRESNTLKAVEGYARGRGQTVITPALLAEVRNTWGARFRPRE